MVTPGKLFASVALFWMIAVLRITDGGITFTEPAPPYTPASAELKDERTTYQRIFKGSTNVSLTWNYNISSDETISQLTWSFNGHDVARKLPSGGAGPLPGYENQYGASSSEPATLFIFNVSDDDEGKYAFKVSSSTFPPFKLLQWRDLIDVEVIEEIKITNVSDNQTPCEGSSLTLWCNATGRPMPNITWTRVWPNGSDSEVLQHDTMQNFVLSNINRSDSGTYRCAADNGVGNSINRTIDVSVDFSPTIDPLTNQTVVEGQNVTLQCQASGKPSPTVSWRTATGDLVEEANSTTLINVLRNQSEYICEASNLCGNINESVFLFVQYKPEAIQLHTTPADKVCKDGLVVFNCTADANPDVHTYQLFENDMLMGNSSTGEFNRTMSTGGNFTFKCAAINAVGTANSSAIPYTVNVPPEVQPLSNMITVVEGDNVTLFCNASGSPEPSVNWTNVNTNSITNGATRDFANINRTEAGEYKCDAQNECGSDSKSTFIIVHYPPSIVDISANQTVNESDHLALNCTADSNPQANINWTRVSDNSSVFFPLNITGKEHEGYYRCTADNSVGTPASQDVYVTVERYHPFNTQVMTTLQNNIAMVNETFNITCSAEANPPAYYVFHKNNVFLERIDAHPGVLVTSVAERVNQVDFKCIPFNDYGAGPQQEVTINVHYEPDNVVLMTNASGDTTCSGDVLNLTCTAEANPPANFVLYRDEVIEVVEVSPGVWVESMAADVHYRCAANNSVGSIGMSNNVSLTVNVASSIVGLSSNKTVDEGDNVTLQCNVTGRPPPNVMWTNLDNGETKSGNDWFIQNISRTQAGAYKCEASNGCGSDSETTHVSVLYKPDNVTLTTNVTANSRSCLHAVVRLTCTADASPAPQYMLYKDNTMVPEAQSSPGVWFQTMSLEGDFQYRCVANNSRGSRESNNVTLTVYDKPSLVVPLGGNQEVNEGDNVTLYCNVSGRPEPSVNWTKVGSGVSMMVNPLVLTNINRDQAGDYKCDANNECGDATDTTTITVRYPSSIVALDNKTATKGDNITLTCNASGYPLPTVSWRKVGGGEAGNPWTIQNIGSSDAGEYICEASNSVGNDSTSVFITVQYKPEGVMLLSNVTGNKVCSGAVVNFTCTADASPSVHTYHLKENDTAVDESSSGVWLMTLSTEGNFSYSCMANNTVGTAMSASSLVVVNSAPSVVLVPDPMPWIVDGMKNLTCQVSGRPMPDVFWKKKGGARRNETVWMFSALTTDDAGEYVCTASNECGSVSKGINVTVRVSGCEQSCVDGKECRQFGGEYLCVCQVGKGGEGCNGVETPSETVTTNLRITNETWMEVYNNLEDSVTKAFTKKFEDTVLYTLRNTDANKVTVTKLSRGSVIVDFEAAFNSTHGKSEVDALLKAKSKDGTLGSYRVDSIGSASGSTPPPSTKKCGSFWEGSNCDKVKPGWLALVIIAGVVLLAFIVAIIAFCMQKQKRRGGSISTDDQNGRIGANGVSNGRAPATGAGPHARDNIAYENERYNGDGHERDTPMVTFGHAESRPEQTPGIMANDPSATKKAEPGEGTYADLGQFHSDKPAAAPATEPVVKPPVYEETAYAEITQFLKGPVKSDDDEAAETKEPGDGEEQVSVVVTEDQEDNASNNEEEPPQNIHQAIDGVIIEI